MSIKEKLQEIEKQYWMSGDRKMSEVFLELIIDLGDDLEESYENGYKIYIKDEDHFKYCENYLRGLNYYKGDSCYANVKVITIRHKNNGVYYSYSTLDLSIDDLLEIDIDNLTWLLEN